MDLDEFIGGIVKRSPQQQAFIHFTDKRNVPSIRQHGLLSTRQLRKMKIDVPAPGGNELSMEADKKFGMDAYVHLCFKTGHPMERSAIDDGRIENIMYLRIDPSVIKIPGVMITNGVSNKRGIALKPASEMLNEIDLEVLYTRTKWKDAGIQERLKVAEKCELLVPNSVPVDYITNLGNG